LKEVPTVSTTQPKKSYLKKGELADYKERLLALRSRLRGEVNAMADAALREANKEGSSMPIHMADLGSDNFEQEFTLSLMQNEGDTLGKIEEALVRIEGGVYGTCEECGAKIPKTRLNALPHTAYCVKCAGELQGR
jgi:DnaK suppressor protein